MNPSEQRDPEERRPRRVSLRTLFPRWLRVVVSLSLIAVLVQRLDIAESWVVLRNADPLLFLLAFGLAIAGRAFAAYRWYMLLPEKTEGGTFGELLRLTFVSNFFGLFMPSGVGFEAVRVYGLSHTTSDLALSFSTVLVDRVLALIALMILVLTGLSLSPAELPAAITTVAWACFAILIAGSLALMNRRVRAIADRALAASWLTPVRVRLQKLYARLDLHRDKPGFMLWALAVALVFQLLRVVTALAAARTLGLDVPAVHFAVITPVIVFITQLPISVGGLGVREAGFVYLFGLVGVSPEAAFALALLVYFISVLVTLPGAWYYMRRGIASRAERPHAE